MPKQVGHINSRSLLRWATFDSFSKFIKLNFGFVRHKIFLARLFCARRLLRPRATTPSAPPPPVTLLRVAFFLTTSITDFAPSCAQLKDAKSQPGTQRKLNNSTKVQQYKY